MRAEAFNFSISIIIMDFFILNSLFRYFFKLIVFSAMALLTHILLFFYINYNNKNYFDLKLNLNFLDLNIYIIYLIFIYFL